MSRTATAKTKSISHSNTASTKKTKPKTPKTLQSSDDKPKAVFEKRKKQKVEKVVVEEKGSDDDEVEEEQEKVTKKTKGKEVKAKETSKPKSTQKEEKPALKSILKKPKATEAEKTLKKKEPKKPNVKSKVVEEADEDDEEDSDEKEDGDDGEVLLHGFSSADESSDDEDNEKSEEGEIDMNRLPTVAKDDASIMKRLEKAKKQAAERGTVYLGRIPHGFYEDQMKAYFSQFGNVTRLRLSRSKRTGKSKHYAFIEFDSIAVAEIVAETMDNYLLLGHILRCKVIPEDEVHPELWKGANKKWRRVPATRMDRLSHNKERTDEEQEKVEKRLLSRQEQRKRKIAAAGIDYDFDEVAYTKKTKADA